MFPAGVLEEIARRRQLGDEPEEHLTVDGYSCRLRSRRHCLRHGWPSSLRASFWFCFSATSAHPHYERGSRDCRTASCSSMRAGVRRRTSPSCSRARARSESSSRSMAAVRSPDCASASFLASDAATVPAIPRPRAIRQQAPTSRRASGNANVTVAPLGTDTATTGATPRTCSRKPLPGEWKSSESSRSNGASLCSQGRCRDSYKRPGDLRRPHRPMHRGFALFRTTRTS